MVKLMVKLQTTTVSLIRFSLTSFICSCARHKLTSFSLTRSLVRKLVMPAFEQGSLSRKNLLIYVVHAHEQIKLVKVNLVVCVGLKTVVRQALF